MRKKFASSTVVVVGKSRSVKKSFIQSLVNEKMAQYYQIVQNVDEIKNIYNLDQVQLVMGDDLQFGSQQIVYTHPQSQQIPQAETHFLIQDETGQLINDGTFNQPSNQQIFYQEVPAIMQTTQVPQLQQQQQPVVILRTAPHEQQQQHTMMMQQSQPVILQQQPHPQMVHHQQQQQQIMYNTPQHHQTSMPPPPLVHTSPQPRPQMVNQSQPAQQQRVAIQKIPTHMMQNNSNVVVGQPQIQQGQVVMSQRMTSPQQQHQPQIQHLQPVQMAQHPRPIRVTKPKISRPHVQRPRAPGATQNVVRTRAPVKVQMTNSVPVMRPQQQVMQQDMQNQQAPNQILQQRNSAPGQIQRVVQITNRQQTQTMMISNPNQPGQVVRAQMRKVSINQVSQQTVSQATPQQAQQQVAQSSQSSPQPPQTVTKSASGNDLEDLEDSILSAVIKRPMDVDVEMQSPPPQIESNQSNVQMVMEQQPPQQQQQQQMQQVQMVQNQNVYGQIQGQHSQHQQQNVYPNHIIQLADGNSITMAEFQQFQESQQRKQQENVREGFNPTRGGPRPPMSFGRGNVVRKPVPMNRQQMALQQQQQMEQHRIQQLQQQQQQQTTLAQPQESDNKESAKMLVILQSGEQRLITFTLPKESCTVQELLEQVGVQFSPESPIQCISNPGGDIDYIVTVGVTLQETNDYVKSAEESIKKKNTPQQPQFQEIHTPQPPPMTPQASQQPQLNQTPRFNDSYRQQMMQTPAQATSTPEQKVEPDPPKVTPKVIKGFLAVCKFCGATGINHAQCERCKRVFVEAPKAVKEAKSTSNPPPLVPTATSTPITKVLPLEKTDKEKKALEMAQKNHQIALAGRGTGHVVRGMGVRGRGRGRGMAKHEVEPVIFTLSSDDEESHTEDKLKNIASKSLTNMSKNNSLGSRHMNCNNKPLLFEPIIKEEDKLPEGEFIREDITNIKGMPNSLITHIECRSMRIGTLRYDALEKAVMSSKGIRLVAPNVKRAGENCILDLQYKEVVKIVIHFSKSLNVMFIYTLPSCGAYIRESLEMPTQLDERALTPYYNPLSRSDDTHRRITLIIEKVTEESKSVVKTIFSGPKLEEISLTDANQLLVRTCNNKVIIDAVNSSTNTVNNSIDSGAAIRKILIYPPGKGGISINTEDYMCLAIDQYLNDVIIDFYLNYVKRELLKEEEKEKVYVFSTFFYKRLTTVNSRHRASDRELKLTAAQKRHGRVASWTKKDNIFEKDFIIIPINEQSHWFLAIICFPHMEHAVNIVNNAPTPVAKKKKLARKPSNMSLQIGSTTITPVSKKEMDTINIQDDDASERDEAEGDESELASDNEEESEEEVQKRPAVKQPCILIFDSLSGAARSRVVATLRDYLTCEYKVKMPDKPPKVFSKQNMPGHCVKVPQQNNFTDCGLYLLQYVEQFFLDPIKDYHLPIRHLSEWFDTLIVTKKREDISNLLKKLISGNNPEVLPLPDIKFPTQDGKLIIDPEDEHFNEGEFEEEELEEAMVTDDSAPNGQKVLTTKLVNKVAKRALEEKEENGSRKTPKIVESSITSPTTNEDVPVNTVASSS